MQLHYIKKESAIWMLGLFAVGCANTKPAPEIASSANAPGYAMAYPGALSENLTRYTDHAVDVKENGAAFKTYPEELKEPDWQVVAAVYQQADQDGRGQAFADTMAEDRMVRRFFNEEKDDLTRRTSGAVANAIKKADCNCEVETHGSVAFALKDGVEKQLEERQLEAGGAEALIQENEKRIGKKNVKTLSSQAAAISLSAYLVFVELPTIYQELDRRLGESRQVKKTLNGELNREKARLSDPEVSKADKKEAEKQIAAINDALSTINIFEEETKRLVERANKEIPAIQKSYEDAFDALMDAVKSRITN